MGYTDTSLTAAMFDDEGWYQTGDMAVMDEEGFVTITDRVADVIIRGGENISAVEVEEAMMRLPGVAEVAVVAAPDERLGEHACAFVRLVDPETTLTLETVIGHLGDLGLTRQKWPEELRLVSEFSRTATGKIRKVDLRAQFDG
jgi:non-ribosomal peptide synthetase component E (peptide arylation enzyme)